MRTAALALLVALSLAGCEPQPATAIAEFGSDDFWATPFPGEHHRLPDGHIDMEGFPARTRNAISVTLRDAAAEQTGFGTTTPIFFPMTAAIDPSNLPAAIDDGSIDAPLFLMDVDPDSPARGTLAPIIGRFLLDAGPYGTPNLLAIVPVQGRPLRPDTMYAAVVTSALLQESGAPLERAAYVTAIGRGEIPTGLEGDALTAFRDAHAALLELGVQGDDIIAYTAFRTGAPTAIFERALSGARANGERITLSAFDPPEVYDAYCAYHAVATVPVFQDGIPPYVIGGRWVLDASGAPIRQREESANVWVTVPRRAMPTDGFPAAVLVRTGAGADRPLMDRGPRDAAGESPRGTGLGLQFAEAGFVGVSIEGPHGGSRNITGGDEQFIVFNIQNVFALRDNLRQSALELSLLVDALPEIDLDPSGCPDVSTVDGSPVRIDGRSLALVGHSMGASIAPLTAAFEPRYRALILSGAGASWSENILYKLSPIPTLGIANTFVGYAATSFSLNDADPILSLLQWAGEEADAQVYAPLMTAHPTIGSPRHVLMFQGIEDTYIPPPVANALTLALEIDVGGTVRDRAWSAREGWNPIESLLPHVGRSVIALPATANLGGETTAVVVQLDEDGIQDGHEVMWQRSDAREMVRCFLSSLAAGTPTVVDPAAPCDGP